MGFKWTAAGPGLRAARAIVTCHTQPVSGRVVCGSAGAPLRPSWLLLLLLLLSYLASARCCRRRGRCGEILMRRTGRPIVLRHVQSLPRGARAVAPCPGPPGICARGRAAGRCPSHARDQVHRCPAGLTAASPSGRLHTLDTYTLTQN